MSKLKYLIIHCTDTPEGREVTKQDILDWHTKPKPYGRGWSKAGYRDMILLNSDLVNITPFDQDNYVQGYEMTNGVKGINSCSSHLVYVGGQDSNRNPKDTRTDSQKMAMEIYIKYMVLRHPEIQVAGHNNFSNKACPSFDVRQWLKQLILEKNIY